MAELFTGVQNRRVEASNPIEKSGRQHSGNLQKWILRKMVLKGDGGDGYAGINKSSN